MRNPFRLLAVLTCSLCLGSAPQPLAAAEPSVAELLPASTAVFAEISNPRPIIDAALADQTIAFVTKLEPYQKYAASNNYRTLLAVVGMLETKLDAEWKPAIGELLGGGVALAFDPARQALVVVVRSRDEKLLNKLHDAVVELVEFDAKSKGRESPVKSQDYRGVVVWSFGKDEAHALLRDTLVISNKLEAVKAVVDRHLAAGDSDKAANGKSLADDDVYRAARKHAAPDDAGFGFVRLSILRPIIGLTKVLSQKSNNPVAEILLGGTLDAVGKADYLAMTLAIDGGDMRLAAHLPHDRANDSESRRWFFSPKAGESAAPALEVAGTIASLTAYRDVGGMWVARNELFDEKTNVGFTQADTNLGLYFSGRDFGTQVLGELSPRWRFVAARREFGLDGEPVPALKLPAFAVVWELEHADDFGPHLQLAFQNIIGITNIDGAQKGRPQLLLQTERRGNGELHYGHYLMPPDQSADNAPIHFNFRPAAARVGKYFVAGTHVALVRELTDQLDKQPSAPTTADSLRFDVQAQALADVLEANRPLIVGRTMLSAGGDQAKADEQLNLGLELLRLLDDVSLALVDGEKSLSLELAIKYRAN